MQAFGARGCNHVFRTGDTVPGKERMRMQVDVKGHRLQDMLERVRCKVLVSTKRRFRECLNPKGEARRNDKNRLYSRHLGMRFIRTWTLVRHSSFGFRHFARSNTALTRRHWEAHKELS